MPVHEVFATVFPVFALISTGWVLARVRGADLATITDLVVYLGGPSLVFAALVTGDLSSGQIGELVAGTVGIVLGLGAVVYLGASIAGRRPGALYLPAMFFNAGNMLLPLCLFAFGEDGMRRGVIIFATMTLLQSTLGVGIASGRRDLTEMFRLPYIYAILAALAVRAPGWEVPMALLRPIELLGGLAVPLMLLALGVRLSQVQHFDLRRSLLISVIRIGGGYAVALTFVTLFGIEGLSRNCLLLASVMPAAVVNFVFAEKYGNQSAEVATAVFTSTVVSLVTTPLVLTFGI